MADTGREAMAADADGKAMAADAHGNIVTSSEDDGRSR